MPGFAEIICKVCLVQMNRKEVNPYRCRAAAVQNKSKHRDSDESYGSDGESSGGAVQDSSPRKC